MFLSVAAFEFRMMNRNQLNVGASMVVFILFTCAGD